MNISLQGQQDKTAQLQNEILKLQAGYEKDRILVESLRCQLVVESDLQNELILFKNKEKEVKELWDSEKYDLNCNISVLTEERDAAQSNEEILFEKLEEKTLDLEILQESYVDMTDKCNDGNDEIEIGRAHV